MTDEYEQKIPNPEQTTPAPETITPTPVESNDFPKVTEFISQEGLEEKKDNINKVLSDNKIKEGFENFLKTANPRIKLKIKKDLLNCKTEEEVKSIIVENLPGYKIGESENILEDGDKPEDGSKPEENGDLLAEVDNKKEDEVKAKEDEVKAKEDEVKAKEDEVKSKEDEVKAKEDEVKAKEEKVTELNDKEDEKRADKIMEDAKAYIKNLAKNHPNSKLEEKVGPESDLYKETKKQLEENGIINKLKQDKHDDEFINNYILVQATLQEVKHNTNEYSQDEISTFDKIVKNLNNACNIPDTNLDSFSSDNIGQTRKELFNEDIGNDSLISAKKSNMESRDYSKVFPEMGDDELIAKYGNQLEGELKEFWQQYQSNPELKNKINEIKNNPNATDEEKQQLKNYEDMLTELKKIKEGTEIHTKDLMEEMCLISQVKGLSMCIGQENGNDFNFNKANEIQNNNGVLTLQGHIDGVDFSVRQDTNNPEAHLKTYSKLATVSGDKNTFVIGGENNYVDSPFILPSQQEIFAKITEVVQSDSDNLKNVENQEIYLENLQKEILSKMNDLYKDTELAHHYITNKVKGEKILDSSLSLIQYIKPNFDLSKSINQVNDANIYSYMKLINFNIENSTTEEKDKLNKCISKIGEIADNYRSEQGKENFDDVKYPTIIENYLKNETWLKDGNENEKFGLISKLLDYYNKNSKDTRANLEGSDGAPSKMIINDLYRDLFENTSSGQSEIATKRGNENKEKQDKDEADNILENCGDLRPPENISEKPSMA